LWHWPLHNGRCRRRAVGPHRWGAVADDRKDI